MMAPTAVWFPEVRSSETLAMPKSSTFTKSGSPGRSSTMMLSGFTSRCTTPCSWLAASARATCSPSFSTRCTGIPPCWCTSAASVSPSRYSMTK